MNKNSPWKRWLWYFSLIGALLLLYKLGDDITQVGAALRWLAGMLTPFLVGFALAFLLHGPSNWLEKRFLRGKGKLWPKLARPLALTVTYLLLLGVIALAVSLIIPQLLTSLTELFRAIPGYVEATESRLQDLTAAGGLLEGFDLSETLSTLIERLRELLNRVLTTENLLTAVQGVLSVTTSVLDVIIAFIVSVYMLAGREKLLRDFKATLGLFMKQERISRLGGYSRRISAIFYNYLYGAFIDALAVGVVVSVGLLIFRVPYAVLLGMLLGLLNMIPYFGAVTGGAFVVLITLLSSNIYTAIGVAVYIVVVQQLDANILQPRVVGGTVGLRPIYVLLGITVFGGLLGFWGVFLGVPLMAVIQLLVKDAIAARSQRGSTTETE